MSGLPDPLPDTLEGLYALVPDIDCRGRCANSCGPIDMSIAERQRIRSLGKEIPRWTQENAIRWANQERLDCPALGAFRQCTVYDVRPLICRLWGVTEGMPCVWGCKPKAGYLSDEDALVLIGRSMEIGGHDELDDEAVATIRKLMADPVTNAVMKDHIHRRPVDWKKAVVERNRVLGR